MVQIIFTVTLELQPVTVVAQTVPMVVLGMHLANLFKQLVRGVHRLLVVLVVIGAFGIAQFDAAKRASFKEGFRCATDETTQVIHSSLSCKAYRDEQLETQDISKSRLTHR